MDSMRKVKADSLKKVQQILQKQIDDANTLVGAGWPELPETLPLMLWTQQREDSLAKSGKNGAVKYSVIELDIEEMQSKAASLSKKGHNADSTSKDNKRILVYPTEFTKAILGCIDEATYWGGERYMGLTDDMKRIKVETGFWGTFFYVTTTFFSKAFWGFLLTAIAISLGAPFWFDLLNKLMQIRGSVKEPTQTQSGTVATSGTGTSDPAHPINRKG
jgi:hypothetical protein